ncbi:hypothetical protein BGX27_000021 [Mortierella sp. AM989]|nr:hypothetical protein BGX27_000021 [Mortierella sp. AM989]
MSSSISQISPENHNQLVRQLYLDATLIEQTIQQHVEANKVGYRSSNSSHPSSPTSERRLNLSDTSSTSQHHRRQSTAPSPQNQRRSGRQQQQTPQEEQGFQVPPSTYFRSSHEELAFLRDSLKDIYEVVLLEDLVAAVEMSVDERLWRHVFYTPIEELRAELRKLDKNGSRRQEVMDELSKLLDKGTGFYHELIMALRCDHSIDLSTVAVDVLQSDSAVTKNKPAPAADTRTVQNRRNGRNRQQSRSKEEPSGATYSTEALANCIQKCFIYLGDLARYRTNIRLETQVTLPTAQSSADGSKLPQVRPAASDWQAAHRFYTRAIQTFPDSGKPYGQLAILASYANDDLDALYWYTLSLGAKCPFVVVRDNLKVFFSRYQNRYKDLLSSICPAPENMNGMSIDEDTDAPREIKTNQDSAQQSALARCDIIPLFIKIQMDLFTPYLESATFSDSKLLSSVCQKLSSGIANEGFESTVQKMVASIIMIVYDLHARTSLSPFAAESTTKEGTLGLKQAQRVGLIYLLEMITVVLDHQLRLLHHGDAFNSRLSQDLLLPTQILIEFWISHWDQVWGLIRLEEKWASVSSVAQLSLRKATVAFFRSFVNLINTICSSEQEHPNPDNTSQKALSLLQDDRRSYFGLLPFRRFHSQLSVCFDVVEDPAETRLHRLLLFTDKVIQASESIRGTIVELSIEPVTDENDTGPTQYRMLDADDKRLLREKGAKMLASHWLQDQVSSLQKGLDSTDRRSGQYNHQDGQHSKRDNVRSRPLVPISTLPGTVKLPLSGQTRLTDHFQRGTPKFGRSAPGRNNSSKSVSKSHIGRGDRGDKGGTGPFWTCVVDFSVLVWRLSEVRTLLEHRRCLIIVPLDIIDRLDQAKKGHDKENQKAREAIRFLDEWLNIAQWGMSEPLLVGQNVKDTLGRWSEAVQFLVAEEIQGPIKVWDAMNDHTMTANDETTADGDVVMEEAQLPNNPSNVLAPAADSHLKDFHGELDGETAIIDDPIIEDDDDDDEEEVEVRNAMNVPRIWRPVLDACLFMLRKRDSAHRVQEDRFVLLTEDQDLAYYAEWFNIPSSNIQDWKHNGI